MKYQVPKEHYFRMYNKVFDLDLKATTFLVYSYLVCCAVPLHIGKELPL